MSAEDEALLAAAVRLFNAGDPLAAHELLDELWEATEGAEADFYKGLIQVCIALHKHAEGTSTGARMLERGARRLLAPYLPDHRGLDLSALLGDLQAALRGAPEDDGPRPRIRSASA